MATIKSSNFKNVRANRNAFSAKNGNNDLPKFFSWILENEIAGMALPTERHQIDNLASRHNIGLVVSCIEIENCPPDEYFTDNNVQNLSIHWTNYMAPTKIDEIDAALTIMRETFTKGKAIVCHCYAGKGRTGTALAAYLIKYYNYGARQAIEHIRKLRPGSIETEPQEKFLVDFYNSLNPENKEEYLPPHNIYDLLEEDQDTNRTPFRIKLKPVKQ